MIAALSDPSLSVALGGFAPLMVKASLAAYVPGSPFMYMNMVSNRKSAFKKRFAPPPEPPKAPVGVEFPIDDKGGRSTSEVGKQVFAAAFAGMGTPEGKAASAKCLGVKNCERASPIALTRCNISLACTAATRVRSTHLWSPAVNVRRALWLQQADRQPRAPRVRESQSGPGLRASWPEVDE